MIELPNGLAAWAPQLAVLADLELGGVDPDRDATGSGVEVIAGQRGLALLIEIALRIQRQRMRRDDDAAMQSLVNIGVKIWRCGHA